jgi:hypothetical protein
LSIDLPKLINTIPAYNQVPESCHLFAAQQGAILHTHGLRYNFLLHLFNFWDNSLIAASHISSCMAIVDAHAVDGEHFAKEFENSSSRSAEDAPRKVASVEP